MKRKEFLKYLTRKPRYVRVRNSMIIKEFEKRDL